MSKMDIALKKCITPAFRVSFPVVFKPKSFQNQEPKYSITMLFDESTDLKPLKRAALNAAIEKWGEDKTKWPKKLRLPFRDGGEKEDMEGYGEGVIFVSASSKTQPGLVDARRERIINESDFYAGCWARAELIAFAYDVSGNKGVSFSLQNLQKIKDDKAFSGRKAAEDVFDVIDDGSDDIDAYETASTSSSSSSHDFGL